MKYIYILTILLTTLVNTAMAEIHIGVTAHRGNSSKLPENTLESINSAINLKVDWVEIDIHLTKDQRLIVIHDKNTRRVSDLNLKISDSTYQELKEADVSYKFQSKKETPPYYSYKIPLLSEVFELIDSQEKVRLSLQPKCECIERIIDLAKKMNVIDKIGFNDTSFEKISLVKKINPKIPVFWDRHPFTILTYDINRAKKSGFEYIVIHKARINSSLIEKSHDAGLKIGAWTVNSETNMKKLLSMNIDRLYTDDPELLISVKDSLLK